jgi:23S rRNA (uracil1939-C5)-methyltransferase
MVSVTITALGGLGDGIGEHNGLPVFLEKAAVGDVLSVRLTQSTRQFHRGEIVEILAPGPERVPASCPHFARCGGCSLQQLGEDAYRAHKHKVLADALAHAGFAGAHAELVFLPMASRRRVELKWSDGKFAYYAPRSRQLVAIDQCLILEPALQALLPKLAEALRGWPQAHVLKTISLTAADSGVDVVINLLSDPSHTPQNQFWPALAETLSLGRVVLGGKVVAQRQPITMRLGEVDVPLPPDAFLQATREGQRLLSEAVVSAVFPPRVGKSLSIADLFCGLGTYSFALAKHARVYAVELDTSMSRALAQQAKAAGMAQLSAETRDLFTAPLTAAELARFDAVVINPPRPGAKAQCEEIGKSTVQKLVMVSCSPASFARDAKILKNAGFSMVSAQGIDQFVYSGHLEIVAVFGR